MTTVEQLRARHEAWMRKQPGGAPAAPAKPRRRFTWTTGARSLVLLQGLAPVLECFQYRAAVDVPALGTFLSQNLREHASLGCWSCWNLDWTLVINQDGTGYAINRARTNPFNAQGNT